MFRKIIIIGLALCFISIRCFANEEKVPQSTADKIVILLENGATMEEIVEMRDRIMFMILKHNVENSLSKAKTLRDLKNIAAVINEICQEEKEMVPPFGMTFSGTEGRYLHY